MNEGARSYLSVTPGASSLEPSLAASILLLPERAVEGAVLDCFRDVPGQDLLRLFEVRDRARDAQDAIVGAGRQAELDDCVFHLFFALTVELAEAAQCARGHFNL